MRPSEPLRSVSIAALPGGSRRVHLPVTSALVAFHDVLLLRADRIHESTERSSSSTISVAVGLVSAAAARAARLG